MGNNSMFMQEECVEKLYEDRLRLKGNQSAFQIVNIPRDANTKPENSLTIYRKLYNTCMDIMKHPFNLAYNFIGTRAGYFLTIGVILLGLAAFIALTTYGLPVTATAVLVGAVLGSFVGAAVGGALQQCGLFKAKTGSVDAQSFSIVDEQTFPIV